MDLREQIEARKRERANEEKDKKEQDELEAKVQDRLDLERAKKFLRENPEPSSAGDDEPLTAEQQAIKEARKQAEKVIGDEAGSRAASTFNIIVFILLFGFGVIKLFTSGWVGLLWIAGAIGYIALIIAREKSRLLDEA